MYEEFALREFLTLAGETRYQIDITDSASISFVDYDIADYLQALFNKYLSARPLSEGLAAVEGFLRWVSERDASNRKDPEHATQARNRC